MIRTLDLESSSSRGGGLRSAVLPIGVLLVVGLVGGIIGGTMWSSSAHAADHQSVDVQLSASSTDVAGSGGRVIYTYDVTNTSDDGEIELVGLVDDLLGALDDAGTCSLPQMIEPNDTYTCAVAIDLVDRAGSAITTTVVATANGLDGLALHDSATETVRATEHARLVIVHSGEVRPSGDPIERPDEPTDGFDLGDGGLFGDGAFDDDTDQIFDEIWGEDDGDHSEPPAEPQEFEPELGYSDSLVEAPQPVECAGRSWKASPDTHMGDFHSAELRIDTAVTLAPGTWRIADLVLHDADIDRPFYPQADERMRVEFWRDDTRVAASAPSTDLVDGHVSAWSRGALGIVELPNGADRIELVHSNVFAGTVGTNSFEPHSLCLVAVPAPVETESEPVVDDSSGAAEIDFVITVENVGRVPVFGLLISDAPVENLTCDGDIDQLAAGASVTCSGTYAATPDEVLWGRIQSTITVDTLQTLPRTSSTTVLLPAI